MTDLTPYKSKVSFWSSSRPIAPFLPYSPGLLLYPSLDIFDKISTINSHLYLSGLQAITPKRLQNYGVTLLISIMPGTLPEDILSQVTTHVQVPVEDIEFTNLGIHFDALADRIAQEARRGGRTLVHCMAGVSRSASIVLAYLIKYQKMSLAEAYDRVRSIRPCIQPNLGFWRQLIAYEEVRRGTTSMWVGPNAMPFLPFPRTMSSGLQWNHPTTSRRPRFRKHWSIVDNY
ncbi:unnamed protein product [Mesocestoides corti]|uniref:Protein-tyrosine-phosphatase n=1 Tax=Mesocestoides corti TaxID=53468 RepID=A0A0R3U2J4_MESCO|nr:unnamed protein product [Mesocestoides corti]